MPADEAALLELADAVLDGRPIAWGDASVSLSDEARALVPQFQAVAEIAAFARSSSLVSTLSAGRGASRDLLLGGTTWGPLTIVEPVGHGSFGDVYRALDPRLDRPVALKLLRRRDRGQAADSAVIDEARLMARVRHPNVVTVYGAERIDGRVGIWMEFVDGRSLEDALKARGPLPAADLAPLGLDLCRALGAIHKAGLLHRDLKAHNVLCDAEGRVLVTDFGAGLELAELDAADRALAGTPLYLAPEVFGGARPSPQSDIYSLGVLLFHLATGSYPVTGRTLDEVRLAHRDGRRSRVRDLRPDLHPSLAAVIDRALAADAPARFAAAPEMAAALEAAMAPPPPGSARTRRLATTVAVVAGLVVAVAAGVAAPRLWRTTEDGAAVAALVPRRILLPPGQIFRPTADARAVPYVDTNSRAQIWDIGAGRQRALTREEPAGWDWDPVVAPDGQRLAFATELPDDSWEVRLLNTDGTLPRPLIARQSAFQPVPADWSSDGQFLLCWLRQKNGTRDLVLVPTDGGRPRLVHTFTGNETVAAVLSPDGRFVAATVGVPTPDVRTDLLLLNVSGGDPIVLVEGIAAFTEPSWAPDGRVYFLRESDKQGSRDAWAMAVGETGPAGEAVLAARDLGSVSWLHLMANGMMARPIWNFSAEVYTRSVDLTGRSPAGPPSRIVPEQVGNHGGPAWSPDGRSLGYFTQKPVAAVNGAPLKVLTVSDMATGGHREIETTLFFLGGYAPRWLPDRRSVIVFGSDAQPSDRYGFYRVDLQTGEATPVLTGRDVAPQADVSADGRTLYIREEGRGLVARDLASGRERAVVDIAAGPIGSWRLGPDGRSVAYTRQLPGEERRTLILVLQHPNGTARELLRVQPPDYLRVHAWTPDGRGILYTRASGDRPYRLWLMPLDGRPPVDLQTSFIRSGSGEPNGLSLHPDGRQIAYPERMVQAELWVTSVTAPAAQATAASTPD